MVGLIVKVIGAIGYTIAVHVVVLVGFIAVVVVIFAGGIVGVTTAAVGSSLMGGGGQRGNEDQKTGKSQGGEFLTHGNNLMWDFWEGVRG